MMIVDQIPIQEFEQMYAYCRVTAGRSHHTFEHTNKDIEQILRTRGGFGLNGRNNWYGAELYYY